MVSVAEQSRGFSFWQIQIAGWSILYLLLLAAAGARLGERDIFRYNTVGCLVLFCASLLARPLCRAAANLFKTSPFASETGLFAICLPVGCLASLATGLGTFGWERLTWSNWQLCWLQSACALFLWCHLYISLRQRGAQLRRPLSDSDEFMTPPAIVPPERDQIQQAGRQFFVRTGTRVEIVPEEAVLWFAAAGDYVELHTATETHLVRATMRNLEGSLDPAVFIRIHRSRIVRWVQIAELAALDNGEYRVRLRDGSEHRSSRIYARRLAQWISPGAKA